MYNIPQKCLKDDLLHAIVFALKEMIRLPASWNLRLAESALLHGNLG